MPSKDPMSVLPPHLDLIGRKVSRYWPPPENRPFDAVVTDLKDNGKYV